MPQTEAVIVTTSASTRQRRGVVTRERLAFTTRPDLAKNPDISRIAIFVLSCQVRRVSR
jgi:hypothetical protein